jgi:hypothetical protein
MIYPILRQFGLDPYGVVNKNDADSMDKLEAALKFGRGLFTLPMLGSGYLVRSKTEKDNDTTNDEVK